MEKVDTEDLESVDGSFSYRTSVQVSNFLTNNQMGSEGLKNGTSGGVQDPYGIGDSICAQCGRAGSALYWLIPLSFF